MDWFKKKYFSGERNYCYVIEMEVRTVGSGVVGFCRYDYVDDHYVVSIAINPSFHGRGLGGRLLRDSMGMLPDDGVRLSAEILKGNIGSIRLFERAGFRLDREESDRVFYVFDRKKRREK
jgi:RimJ/RimL family protein N-acetyltransferase